MKFEDIKIGDKVFVTSPAHINRGEKGTVFKLTKETIAAAIGEPNEYFWIDVEFKNAIYRYGPADLGKIMPETELEIIERFLNIMGERVYFNFQHGNIFAKQFGRIVGISKRSMMPQSGCGEMKDYYKAIVEFDKGIVDINFNDIQLEAEQERVRPRQNTNRSRLG